ncbi:cytochrome c [Candidatus Scalindua japonica]|uniref:Cytochrome c n=1 Tax=Candidatus Scalindua japonica TaxID=1284222 RepID=A0A286TXT6_9BACT|nr:cytochrome c [Candidatus Scalindua japonica]
MEVKCTKCMHSFEVEETTKKYRFPFYLILTGTAMLAYEHTVNNPSLIITALGDFSVTVGIIWMIVTRGRVNKH